MLPWGAKLAIGLVGTTVATATSIVCSTFLNEGVAGGYVQMEQAKEAKKRAKEEAQKNMNIVDTMSN